MIAEDLDALDEQQLRQALRSAQQALSGAQHAFKQAVIDKITQENAPFKRLTFAAKFGAFKAEQKSLLDETLDADLAAVTAEIERLQPRPKTGGDRHAPNRQALPAHHTAHHWPQIHSTSPSRRCIKGTSEATY